MKLNVTDFILFGLKNKLGFSGKLLEESWVYLRFTENEVIHTHLE